MYASSLVEAQNESGYESLYFFYMTPLMAEFLKTLTGTITIKYNLRQIQDFLCKSIAAQRRLCYGDHIIISLDAGCVWWRRKWLSLVCTVSILILTSTSKLYMCEADKRLSYASLPTMVCQPCRLIFGYCICGQIALSHHLWKY